MTIILKGVKVVGVYEMPNPPQIPQQVYPSKGASEHGKLYVVQGGKKAV